MLLFSLHEARRMFLVYNCMEDVQIYAHKQMKHYQYLSINL